MTVRHPGVLNLLTTALSSSHGAGATRTERRAGIDGRQILASLRDAQATLLKDCLSGHPWTTGSR